MSDPIDVTDFRFRMDNTHNRDMLEYRAEKAFISGRLDVAAQFSIAAGLYALAVLKSDELSDS